MSIVLTFLVFLAAVAIYNILTSRPPTKFEILYAYIHSLNDALEEGKISEETFQALNEQIIRELNQSLDLFPSLESVNRKGKNANT